MDNFGMELNCIEFSRWIFHRGDRTVCGVRRNFESLRCLCNIVGMTHPAGCLRSDIGKQDGGCFVDGDIGVTVLGNRGSCHFSAELIGHQLGTVADSEYRDAKFKNCFVISR